MSTLGLLLLYIVVAFLGLSYSWCSFCWLRLFVEFASLLFGLLPLFSWWLLIGFGVSPVVGCLLLFVAIWPFVVQICLWPCWLGWFATVLLFCFRIGGCFLVALLKGFGRLDRLSGGMFPQVSSLPCMRAVHAFAYGILPFLSGACSLWCPCCWLDI